MKLEFRVWDKWRKEYSSSSGFLDSEGSYYDERIETGEPQNKDFVVEQYTGLKDINGNKIFEDDIVRDKHEKTCVVNFKEGSFLVGDFYFGWSIGAGMGLEIIGNIHENPELLEVE